MAEVGRAVVATASGRCGGRLRVQAEGLAVVRELAVLAMGVQTVELGRTIAARVWRPINGVALAAPLAVLVLERTHDVVAGIVAAA
jgi:hypothetical protein